MWGSIRSARRGQRRGEPGPAGRVDHPILLAEHDEHRHLAARSIAIAQTRVHDRGPGGAGRAPGPRAASELAHRLLVERERIGDQPREARAGEARRECGSIGATTRVTLATARCTSGQPPRAPHVARRDQACGRHERDRSHRLGSRERVHDRDAASHRVARDRRGRATPSSSSVAASRSATSGSGNLPPASSGRLAEAREGRRRSPGARARAARRPRARPATTRRGREEARAAGPPRRPQGRH